MPGYTARCVVGFKYEETVIKSLICLKRCWSQVVPWWYSGSKSLTAAPASCLRQRN